MNNTDITVADICKIYQSITEYDPSTTFTDFILMANAEALTALNRLDSSIVVPNIKTLVERYDKYHDRLNDAFNMLMILMEKSAAKGIFEDYLGKIFHQLMLSNKAAGQFFTPQHLSNLTAACCGTDEEIRAYIEKKGYITVSEPACGSGSMILGLATRLSKMKLNPQGQMMVYATDVDARCANMCFFQLNLYGLSATVTHGDTLQQKEYGKWNTLGYYSNGFCLRRKRNA